VCVFGCVSVSVSVFVCCVGRLQGLTYADKMSEAYDTVEARKSTLCCSVLQRVAVCCSLSQCVAVCRSVSRSVVMGL